MTTDQPTTEQPQAMPAPPKVVDSQDLFSGEKTVLIRHREEFYRLLRTKNGKLILQK